MPSWIALRRAVQIAQRVTVSKTNFSCDKDSISVKSHCFALGSVVEIEASAISSSTRAQVHRDVVQLIKECLHESTEPHKPQEDVSAMCLCARTSSVDKECLHVRLSTSFSPLFL